MACLVQFSIVGTSRSALAVSYHRHAFFTARSRNWSLEFGTALEDRTGGSFTYRGVVGASAVSTIINCFLLTIPVRKKKQTIQ